ncbi:glycerophosphodiester phosphodiesterase family protein [Shewanella sp. 1_MG-2023]|uniref:glycerophosphodiester phosphodiesterase family protein n=1 Tax=unclassified Shewanella TaxID=196818 RepID=UPI0026E33489|nr:MULTISPECIES: glycerophosphodiester phosphodiesterase family protein [unclassified Shewanella]MDO6610757.1 glycerophosphodiester phosphodiesterase family protein [Shewanella sp. 7_MG-2023]MDO6770881.1 glycerophosphodiester phosphodiesterase family protein [Shewanella sp. 2_MG-2023]MDO6793100.1 glycerophosphodiester phosphodiesterase family protein [Shewanella sp. 1_MG-2023]
MLMKSENKLALIAMSLGLLFISGCNDDDDNGQGEVDAKLDKTVVVSVGPRPSYLVEQMQDSELKNQLTQCAGETMYRHDFSIGHRGAAMQFPEHTKESYQAAIDSGAGVVECDVTFTQDKALVCRHSQCDLATTTNILAIPELAAKCSVPFSPADLVNGVMATAQCCTSDITLAEFKMLEGKMDGANPNATTVEEFMAGTANWRTDLYSGSGTLMTHAESITMFKAAGVKMTPELKSASVAMPFDGFSQQDYAQKMVDEYVAADVDAANVYPQSFNLEDVKYWIANSPDFGEQGVYLDDRYDLADFDPQNSATWSPTMDELANDGVKIIAPPLWGLVTLDAENQIVPSEYAVAAKGAGLNIITWTLERSGLLTQGAGGWYYQSITDAVDNEGDAFELLDVLTKDVGVMGVFSDWPATVTYYANCMDVK